MARRTILAGRQRSALFSLPQHEADLLRHYTLSDEDLQHIEARRRPRNKLGFALQLCVLRYPGRLLAPGEFIPPAVVDFIGRRQDSNLWPSAPEAGGAARHAVTPAARGEGGRLHSSGDASRASVSADALRARGGAGRRGPPKVRADVTRRRRS